MGERTAGEGPQRAGKSLMIGEPRSLFSNLDGWRMAGPGGFRRFSDGTIESYGGPGLLWYADEAFEDFLLLLEWRIARTEDNSGVFIRAPPLSDSPQPAIERGYEVQIDDRGVDPVTNLLGSPFHMTGAIYQLAPAVRRPSRPVGQWNDFEIAVRGPTISVRLNGEEVSHLANGSRETRGYIGLQNHHEGSAVRFRNLRVVPR
jgi:hypothetical protein